MNRRTKIISAVSLSVGALVIGVIGAGVVDTRTTEPMPDGFVGGQEVVLMLESQRVAATSPGYRKLQLRLGNPTPTAIRYTGYEESQPWYLIERWVDGKWESHRVGWFCGTGLRDCRVPAGRSVVIPVSVEEKLLPLRVGVRYGRKVDAENGPMEVAWSVRIDRDTLLVAPESSVASAP
jgi:hypothetical protein